MKFDYCNCSKLKDNKIQHWHHYAPITSVVLLSAIIWEGVVVWTPGLASRQTD